MGSVSGSLGRFQHSARRVMRDCYRGRLAHHSVGTTTQSI